ncbi:6514_t:CDS:1, partial [Paraglomus occultum]
MNLYFEERYFMTVSVCVDVSRINGGEMDYVSKKSLPTSMIAK